MILGLQFICDYNLKPLWLILPTDSNVNFSCDKDFLYTFFSNYDLKMSKQTFSPSSQSFKGHHTLSKCNLLKSIIELKK